MILLGIFLWALSTHHAMVAFLLFARWAINCWMASNVGQDTRGE